MVIRLILRTVLVAAVFTYCLPEVAGIKFHGDALATASASLVFNVIFLGLEWLLGIVVLGINISTLGLGIIITSAIRSAANLLAPAAALWATAYLLHQFLQVTHFWPGCVVAGLVLGGTLWVTNPQAKKR